MSGRINTIMPCYFALSGVLPKDAAIKQIKKAIEDLFQERPESDRTEFQSGRRNLAHLYEVKLSR